MIRTRRGTSLHIFRGQTHGIGSDGLGHLVGTIKAVIAPAREVSQAGNRSEATTTSTMIFAPANAEPLQPGDRLRADNGASYRVISQDSGHTSDLSGFAFGWVPWRVESIS